MNKTLTPLAALEDIILYLNANEPKGLYCENIEIIKTALKEYEEGLENAKTYVSHTAKNALFDLEVLAMKNTSRKYWKLPQQLANDVKKELKALEIIKRYIKLGGMGIDTSDCYFPYMSFEQKEGLSKEEYDLLKEVLS